MKKVALSTKEEKVLTDIVLSLGVTYLKQFTKKELNKFKNKPVIIPSGDYRFFVGPYVVNGLQKDCWQVTLDGRLIHNFLSKINAFLYCVADITNKYKQSRDIIEWDTKLGNLTSDILYYEKHIKLATDCGDIDRKEIIVNRYIDARLQQTYAQAKLQKTINSAKYNNFRNMNNETNRNEH